MTCLLRFGRLAGSFIACASPPPREADVTAVLDALYGAIAAGQADAVIRLLVPDAVFVEAGKIETRAEYEANHHLPADIEFEPALTSMFA